MLPLPRGSLALPPGYNVTTVLHNLSNNPHLRITEDHFGPIPRLIDCQNTDLSLAVATITDAVNLLVIHIKVKRVSLCDDCDCVGLIQPSVNCWSYMIHDRPSVRATMDDEAVMAVLANSEAIETARRTLGTEDNCATIPLNNFHLHFKGKVAETACMGIARLRDVRG